MQILALFVLTCSVQVVASAGLGDEPTSAGPFGGGAVSAGVTRLESSAPPHNTKGSKAYKRIEAERYCHTRVSFKKIPLSKAMQAISKAHEIPIVVDKRSLAAFGIDPFFPITLQLNDVALRSVLALNLRAWVGLRV